MGVAEIISRQLHSGALFDLLTIASNNLSKNQRTLRSNISYNENSQS